MGEPGRGESYYDSSPSRIRPPPFFLLPEGERGKGEGVGEGKGGAAPFPNPIQSPSLWGACHPFVGWCASLLWPIWPISFLGGSGNPSGTPICTRYILEHFRCPNRTFQYINIYFSTILRLLVMSVISSGTLNNLRSSNHINS